MHVPIRVVILHPIEIPPAHGAHGPLRNAFPRPRHYPDQIHRNPPVFREVPRIPRHHSRPVRPPQPRGQPLQVRTRPNRIGHDDPYIFTRHDAQLAPNPLQRLKQRSVNHRQAVAVLELAQPEMTPETVKALEYAKALYTSSSPAPRPGTTPPTTRPSWPARSTSPTTASRSTSRPRKSTKKEIAEDIDHAAVADRSGRQADRTAPAYPILAIKFTKYPNACKAFMAFMLEADNFNPWLEGAQGYLTHFLNAYDENPIWTADPKRTVFRDVAKRTLTPAGSARSARRRRPRSPTSWCSTCSPTTAPAAKTPRARSRSPSGS